MDGAAGGREPRAWLIRGGADGEREQRALADGHVIVGWDEVGDLRGMPGRQELAAALARGYPDASDKVISNWTGQLWTFTAEIHDGDLVVMPLHTRSGRLAIGRITGPYEYRADEPAGFRHVRGVAWLGADFPREEFKPDLRASMRSLLTVCRLARNDAPRRIAHFAEHGTDPGFRGEETVTDADRLLADAAAREPGNPRTLTIRHLMEHWQEERRTNAVISKIKSDLAEKGLTTRPPFTEGSVSDEIALVPLAGEPGTGSADRSDDTEQTEDVSAAPTITLRLGSLPRPLKTVPSTAALTYVKTLMVQFAFSQLGVVDEDGTFRGAVSWESIGRAGISSRDPSLADATTPALVVDHDALLLDQIDNVFDRGFIFVRDADRKRVTGILTAADLTGQFGPLARPFVLVEEAENRLRRAADETFDVEELRAAVPDHMKHKVNQAADLTFGNYPFLLGDRERWTKLGWRVDRKELCRLIEEVGKIRNDLMHFSPDPLSDDQYVALNGLLDLLRAVDPRP